MRPGNPTFFEHVGVELIEDDGRAIDVPARHSHGYQTLVEQTKTNYQVGKFYRPRPDGGLTVQRPPAEALVATDCEANV